MDDEIVIEELEDEDIELEEIQEDETELENDNLINLGTNNYEKLNNLPQIENVELKGNKTFKQLGAECLSNLEIENLLNNQI